MLDKYVNALMRTPPKLDRKRRPAPPTINSLLLINPFYPKDPHASFGKHVLTPTLALTSLAAATPAHWDVRYFDENLLRGAPPIRPFPRVVGITVHLTFAARAYELADYYRERGAVVVLGGLHVQACPDEAARHTDAVVTGDGTVVWARVLGDIERGRLKKIYRSDFSMPYAAGPEPRRDILPRSGFLTTTSLNATRGCRNRCGFCYLATRGLRMRLDRRTVEQVIRAISEEGNSYVVFTDNNLGADREYLQQLCRALRPLRIIWSAAVSLDVSDDEELVREMALAGCTGVFVGFETLDARNLDDAGKRSPFPGDYARRVRVFHRFGVQVNGSFVFGFDHDTPEVFDRTVEWIEENRLECATFHILTPYPGTPFFEKLEREGRLIHTDWNRYDTAHVVFTPQRMTDNELLAGYRCCYRRLFSLASIWRRRPRGVAAVLPYLAMSILYKRSNWFWYLLIRFRLVRVVWMPLVQLTRVRHLLFRRGLARGAAEARPGGVPFVPAGV